MASENIYENNPLHGVSLEVVLTQLVDHYGFELLNAYLNLNCFKTNPSIESSLKFLKKTTWAKEKLEAFYMYKYHSLPRADDTQYLLPPRDRIVPSGLEQRPPAELSFEDAELLRNKKAEKNRERESKSKKFNPWGE